MSSFINFNNKEITTGANYSAEVIKIALLKSETKSSPKAEMLVKNVKEPVSLNEALVFFTDKLSAMKSLSNAIIEVNEGRVKQFEMDYASMVKDIKKGYGWIDPEYVADTWENSSDSIGFDLVRDEIFDRLIAAGLLAHADSNNPEKAGKYIKSAKDLYVMESEEVNETLFYAFFNNKKIEVEGKDLWDAKQKAIIELKVPKSKVGLLAVVSAESQKNQDFRFESVVTEAKRAGLSKEETLKVAQKFADALAKVDGVKVTVSKGHEEDSFDLDYDGEEFAGGSYNIYKNGDVVNMAVPNYAVYGKMDDDIKTIIKNINKVSNESTVNEGKKSFKFKGRIEDLDSQIGSDYYIETTDDEDTYDVYDASTKKWVGNFHYDGKMVTLLDMPNNIFESTVNEAVKEVVLSNEILDFLEERGILKGSDAQKVHKDLTAFLKEKGINESVVTEAFYRLSKDVIGDELYAASQNLTNFYDRAAAGNDVDAGVIDTIIKELNTVKKAIKKFNGAEEVKGTAYESTITEADNTEILDLVDHIHEIIKDLKEDSTKDSKKTSKLFNDSKPLIARLHSLVEGLTNEGKADYMARYKDTNINLKKAYNHLNDEELNQLYLEIGELIADNKLKVKDATFTFESATNEAFYRMSSDTVGNELYAASQALTTYYDWLQAGNDSGEGKSLDHIIDLLKKCKNSIKKFNKAAEVKGTAYESVVTEGKDSALQDYVNATSQKTFKGGGNGQNLLDGAMELANHIDNYRQGRDTRGYEEDGFYGPLTITAFKKLVDQMSADDIKNNQADKYESVVIEGVSVVNEGRSINKIQKDWSQTTTDMQQKVVDWKEAEGDRKIEILEELKSLTAKKKQLESELESAVAGKDKDVQLAISEDHSADPNDVYEVKPCAIEGTPWSVWEGDVRVECFATKEEAQAFADKQNKEQGLTDVKEGNAFGAARAEAIAKGEKEFEVDGETFKVEDVDKEDKENAEEFVEEATVTEAKFDKKKLMKAVTGDDGIISTGDGKEYVIYKYGNGNDDNDAMWNDKSIFALDQDGEEHEIEYSDIVRYDESIKPSWDNLLEEFEMVEITNEDLRTEIKKFIKKNNEELDEFADNDNWDAMYQKLYDEFGVEADSAKGKDLLKTFQFIY